MKKLALTFVLLSAAAAMLFPVGAFAFAPDEVNSITTNAPSTTAVPQTHQRRRLRRIIRRDRRKERRQRRRVRRAYYRHGHRYYRWVWVNP